jgi:hypothetical protein
MNTPCPSNQEWLSLLDGEATENRAIELRAHAEACPRCAPELALQRQLLCDLAAPVPVSADAIQSVMRSLEQVEQPEHRSPWRVWALAAGALAVVVAVIVIAPSTGRDPGVFRARGHAVPWARKVGVEVWAIEPSPHKLEPGAAFSPATAIVASYHNLDVVAAYLLVFARDARGEIHWAYPGFEDPKSDPAALRLEPAQMHKVLPDSVVFDDLPPGPVDLVTLISREALHVSQIESLPSSEREVPRLRARFLSARIDSVTLRVVATPTPPSKEKP